MSSGLISKWQSRKRGVSIENVMLGLIVVLIFAGLLYGAFTVIQRYNERNSINRMVPPILTEISDMHRLKNYKIGEELEREIVQRGVVPADRLAPVTPASIEVQSRSWGYTLLEGEDYMSLPKGGALRMHMGYSGEGSIDLFFLWPVDGDGNATRGARALCNAMAQGQSTNYNASINSWGMTFTQIANDCDEGRLQMVTFYNQ